MNAGIIDFHAHIYPEKIAAKAVANISEFYRYPMQQDGLTESLLESGRACGISRFVAFTAAAIPGQVQVINDYIASECRRHPELSGFGTLHPALPDPGAEIERIIGLGLRGVKLHPDMQLFNIDDDAMMDIYAALEGRLPVIFHTGDYRYSFSHPARLARVLDAFPKLCVVAAHFGGWSVFDIAFDHLHNRQCYFDVSSSLDFLGLRRAAELIKSYGAERFLFGSDFPMWDPAYCVESFLRLSLSDSEKELILYKNALALLS